MHLPTTPSARSNADARAPARTRRCADGRYALLAGRTSFSEGAGRRPCRCDCRRAANARQSGRGGVVRIGDRRERGAAGIRRTDRSRARCFEGTARCEADRSGHRRTQEACPGGRRIRCREQLFPAGLASRVLGANYARLLSIKKRYDPHGLFFVRHGVGSEDWSDDGFTRMADSD
ncbi:BBE domain-containing protein [Paraburkholderia atlantica]|uniref:BBE domain-containing protein n=1 Tax=Paraburkholderia atlantica TaxID=2654982 RepID=UPI0034A089AD